MESELWPRMLHECYTAGIPVIVVNARVSDRSFERAMKVRRWWGPVLRKVDLWLAQSDEDARRLRAMGAKPESVRAIGNLKYDVHAPRESRVAALVKEAAAGRPIVVAGSTTEDVNGDRASWEEVAVIQGWKERPGQEPMKALLVIAPRHPQRFVAIESVVIEFRYAVVSKWLATETVRNGGDKLREVVILDTIGDLAAVYGVADVAFVGGSLAKRGGHNPRWSYARFGVPVVMGPSYENFRDIVSSMQKANAIRIVQNSDELQSHACRVAGEDPKAARAMGERGRSVFEKRQGATGRAIEAILANVAGRSQRVSVRRPWALPLVPLYRAAIALKDRLRGAPKRLRWPVVSVGSISAGGAGKTPVVIALAKMLSARGWNVDVLSRGYGRSGRGVEWVAALGDRRGVNGTAMGR